MRSARSCLARAGTLCCRAAALWARVEVIAGLIAGPRPRLNLQPPAPSPQLCLVLARMRIPCRDALSASGVIRGMARRKAQNPYGSCLAARGRLAARQSRRFAAPGPAFVRSVALECADRSVSQLLAGTPSGPGGSSNAARVPRCDEARRRRTRDGRADAPRTSRNARLDGAAGGAKASPTRRAGDSAPPSPEGEGWRLLSRSGKQAALNTGSRRYLCPRRTTSCYD